MPKQKETVELTVNGQKFTAWEQVRCTVEFGTFREFSFLATEAVSKSGGKSLPNWSTLQIKPGDKCTIKLAGQLFITGKVRCRTAQYNARTHNVLIAGASNAYSIIDGTADPKDHNGGQLRGYKYDGIGKKLVEMFPGIKYIPKGQNPYSEEVIRDLQFITGESCFAVLGRIGKDKGITLADDENGNVLAYKSVEGGGGGDLIEGKNIEAASARIEDTTIFPTTKNYGQDSGTDENNMRKVCQPAAHINSSSSQDQYKPSIVLGENRQLVKECLGRTDYEGLWNDNDNIDAEITVYGWQKNNGDLWKIAEQVRVDSPMLMLTPGSVQGGMWIQRVEFSQTNERGSLTTLKVVNRLSVTQHNYGLEGSGSGPKPGTG